MYGLNSGTKIDQYVLDRQLGAGGQGSVWQAHHQASPSAPPVALKIIPVRGTPASMVERVRREAEALIRLSTGHPSVVSCHGVIEDPTLGVLAVIMEMVDGLDLEETLKDPRCDAQARESILLHVSRALGYLHDAGFVHRDVKPQNILVSRQFFSTPLDPATVKLVDFGIATPKGNPKPLTEVGTVIGTPAYMPPERIDPMFWPGAPGLPSEDVWALGVVAYEALFGRHPAGVEDDGTLSVYAERYRQIARSGEAWPQLPPGHRWTAALQGALALKRAERLPDGNGVANAVTGGGPSRTKSDPGLRQGGQQKTEIGAPMPAMLAGPGAAPGQTQQGAVHAGTPLGSSPSMPGDGGWAGGYPSGGPLAPAQPQQSWSPVGVPPPPPATHVRSGGGGGGKLPLPIVLLGVVGVAAIAIPAVVLASRAMHRDDAGPDPTVQIPTATATEAPTVTAPAVDTGAPTAAIPPGTTTAPLPYPTGATTGTAPPHGTATGTTTHHPAPTGTPTHTGPTATNTGVPTGTGTQGPPPIGKGTATAPTATAPATTTAPTATATGGRPPPIKIVIPGLGGNPPGGGQSPPPGNTNQPSGGQTSPPGGRPPPIKIRVP